ncbi:hypothetical protein VTI74DRAFT_1353 [Chaetomium olivicolor]
MRNVDRDGSLEAAGSPSAIRAAQGAGRRTIPGLLWGRSQELTRGVQRTRLGLSFVTLFVFSKIQVGLNGTGWQLSKRDAEKARSAFHSPWTRRCQSTSQTGGSCGLPHFQLEGAAMPHTWYGYHLYHRPEHMEGGILN